MTKKLLLLPSVLLGALLIAAPAMAQTKPGTFDVVVGAGGEVESLGPGSPQVAVHIDAGVGDNTDGGVAWFDGAPTSDWVPVEWFSGEFFVEHGDTYNIGFAGTGLTLNFSDFGYDREGSIQLGRVFTFDQTDEAVFGVLGGDLQGIYNIDSFGIAGQVDTNLSPTEGILSGVTIFDQLLSNGNFSGTINISDLVVANVDDYTEIINGAAAFGTGDTAGVLIALGTGTFEGTLDVSGTIVVLGGSGEVTAGVNIFGSVDESATTNFGEILVVAETDDAVYGIANVTGTADSTINVAGSYIYAHNEGDGIAVGISMERAAGGAASLTLGADTKIEVYSSAATPDKVDGHATGVYMKGDNSELTLLDGAYIEAESLASGNAFGIAMEGDNAVVTLRAGAVVDAYADYDGTDWIDGAAVLFVGDAGTLNLGTEDSADVFDNGTWAFHATGMETVNFDGNTTLLSGALGRVDGAGASALGSITVADGAVVVLGNETLEPMLNLLDPAQTSFEIFATNDFTFSVDGTFTTFGASQFGTGGNSEVTIGGSGTTNLLGMTVLSGDAVFTVEDGATLGFNLAKTNLNVFDASGDFDGMDSLHFDMGVGSTLNIYGDVSADKAYLEQWKFLDDAGSNLDDLERRYATVAVEDETDYGFASLNGGTRWELVWHEGLDTFFIVPYATGDMFLSDGFLVALGMHNRYAAWHAVRDRMISSTGFNRNGFRGQSPCDALCGPCDAACDPCEPACGTVRRNGTRNAWVNYTGRSDALRGSNGFFSNDWRISVEGVQAGADLFLSRNAQFGVLFGYEGGRALNTGNLLKMDDVYVGAYGARVFRNGFDARGVVAFGWQDFDYDRDDNGTLATTSFKGNTTEVNLELGRRFALYGSNWSFRPVMGLDVFNNNIKSATDSVGYKYDKTSLTQAFLRFGSDLRYQTRNFTFNSGFYYSYDMNDDVLRTNVSGAGVGVLSGAKLGRNLLTFNVGTDYQVTSNFSVFGGYQGEYATDRDNSQVHSAGYVGAGFKW